MSSSAALAWDVLKIIWIDILLSGDNTVLIALACRRLPQKQRRLGVMLGALGGVALRIVFALVIVKAMNEPYVKLLGGVLLLYVAVRLPIERDGHSDVEAGSNLWSAVATIVVADALMSFDNVIAIAAAAHGSAPLIVFGLTLSVPIIMFGAGALLKFFERFPILMWLGGALLGWVAGELVANDAFWPSHGVALAESQSWFAAGGAGFAVAVAAGIAVLRAR